MKCTWPKRQTCAAEDAPTMYRCPDCCGRGCFTYEVGAGQNWVDTTDIECESCGGTGEWPVPPPRSSNPSAFWRIHSRRWAGCGHARARCRSYGEAEPATCVGVGVDLVGVGVDLVGVGVDLVGGWQQVGFDLVRGWP